jgi:hypothetical protein
MLVRAKVSLSSKFDKSILVVLLGLIFFSLFQPFYSDVQKITFELLLDLVPGQILPLPLL